MGLDVLFIVDVEKMTLAGIMLAMRGAQRQGASEQFIAGILAQAEHTCLVAKGDWPGVLAEARSLLGSDDQAARLLDSALQLRAG
jgi:hypothetical protein